MAFSGAPSRSLAARLITEAFWQHLVEQNRFGLTFGPPALKRFKQIGLPQPVSESAANAGFSLCTTAKIDAAVLVLLIALPVLFGCGLTQIKGASRRISL